MRAGRTKEFRATTLLDMGGLLPREMWFTMWPDIKKLLDAGFATTIFSLELAYDAIHTRNRFIEL